VIATDRRRLRKLLDINKKTGINTRSSVIDFSDRTPGLVNRHEPPTILELDEHFRTVGVELAVKACKKALHEWGGSLSSITHTVAVTCTNQGSPGYDLAVREQLGLPTGVDHTLVQGVGCAGGAAIVRLAGQLAAGAAAMGEPARILAFACELCTPNVRSELADVEKARAADVGIAGALFSDAAAAFVLCNDLGLDSSATPILRLASWAGDVIPGTAGDMSSAPGPHGESSRMVPCP
jgi:fungal type III polyketide synthase